MDKKKSKKMAVIVFTIGFSLFCALFVGVFSYIRNHPSYKTAISYIETNAEIRGIAGEIEGYGYFFSGRLTASTGTTGTKSTAKYRIKVKGSRRNFWITVYLEKYGSSWEVTGYFISRR